VPSNNNTLPPDLNVGANQAATNAAQLQTQQRRTDSGLGVTGAQRDAAQQAPSVANQPNGSPTPVAAGEIRLESDQTTTDTRTGVQPAARLPAPQEDLR
jgi:hypothetical protein